MGNACTVDRDEFEKNNPQIYDFRYQEDGDMATSSQFSSNLKASDGDAIRESDYEDKYEFLSMHSDPFKFDDPYVDMSIASFKAGSLIREPSTFLKKQDTKPPLPETIPEDPEEPDEPTPEPTPEPSVRSVDMIKAEPVERMNPLTQEAQETLAVIDPFIKPNDPGNDFNSVYGPYRYPDRSTYRGQYSKGWRNGVGMEITADGGLYEGQFFDGQKDGYARKILPNGDYYEGVFKHGHLEGQGKKRLYATGVTTKGQFVESIPNGDCIETYRDGSRYEGPLVNGLKEGQGKYTFADGIVYIGEFRDDVAEGKGKPSIFLAIFSLFLIFWFFFLVTVFRCLQQTREVYLSW